MHTASFAGRVARAATIYFSVLGYLLISGCAPDDSDESNSKSAYEVLCEEPMVNPEIFQVTGAGGSSMFTLSKDSVISLKGASLQMSATTTGDLDYICLAVKGSGNKATLKITSSVKALVLVGTGSGNEITAEGESGATLQKSVAKVIGAGNKVSFTRDDGFDCPETVVSGAGNEITCQ